MNELKDVKSNTVPNIWAAQENEIRIYKWIACGLGGFIVLLFIFLMVMAMRNPLVVTEKNGSHEYHRPVRRELPIENQDIEEFTRQFLDALFVWSEVNVDTLQRNIGPFVEPELLQKIVAAQTNNFSKELKDKKLEQDIAFVQVDVLKDRVTCRFSRILKVQGVPVVMPTNLTLAMIKGASTISNPMGVYIAGITEHETTK